MSHVAARVTKIIAEHLQVQQADVVPQASFVEDLGADSIDGVELVMALEREFSLKISDEAAESIQTVGDAIHYIVKNG